MWNQTINIIYPNERIMFMVPNHEMKRYYYVNLCLSNWKTNLNFKNGRNSSFYQSINIIYPNEENVFMVPNHELNGDYYVNPCLSQLKTNFNSKGVRKRSVSSETKALISFIRMRRMCLWYPIINWTVIIIWIRVYSNWRRTSILKVVEREMFLLKPKH